MKRKDFDFYLKKYINEYLPDIKGCSPLTVDSYRLAFIFLLDFLEEVKGIKSEDVTIKDLNYRNIIEFYPWYERTHKCSAATRNQRQAAINSFMKYLMREFPEYMFDYKQILSIPSKHAESQAISYLKIDGLALYFNMINDDTPDGFRDKVMVTVMHATGIRVSELIGIRVKDISMQPPYTILVHGKRNKNRYVPLGADEAEYLKKYLSVKNLLTCDRSEELVFKNHNGGKLTRQGVNYIITKYTKKARDIDTSLVPPDFSPHKMRHTTAMELVDKGTDLIYVRDLLGHVSVKTTERYGKANPQKAQDVIVSHSEHLVDPNEQAQWKKDPSIKEWLKAYGKRIR